MKNIVDLSEVKNLSPQTFKKPAQYEHLGVEFSDQPKWIEFNLVRRADRAENNSGRPRQHTPAELKTLQDSFADGVQTWQELPIVSETIDPDVNKNKPYNLEVGFGRTNAISSNGQDGYWHWVVERTQTQLDDMAAFENTQKLLDTEFQTGEEGIEHHLKELIEKNALANDEEEIEKKIKSVWPGLNAKSKGRILSNVKNQKTKPRQYQTYNAEDIKIWLSETAAVSFVTGGNWDSTRNKVGYSAVNMLDPWINACMQYAKTGKKSYVVLTVKSPGVKSTLQTKRQAHIDKLDEYESSFRKLGMKVMPLEILGFMPQDNINEDMRYLVNINGDRII